MVKKEEYYAINKRTLIIAAVIVIITAVLLGLYFKGSFDAFLGEKPLSKTNETGPPPKFDIIAIENPDCEACMNVSVAIDIIKEAPKLNITSDKIISFKSSEAKKLIEKYGIDRLPAFILKGKNLDASIPPFEKNKDALVFAKVPPVYYDLKQEEVVGMVNVVMLTKPDCKSCFNVSKLVDQLSMMGMVITSVQEAAYDSTEGKALIKEYSLVKIPTIILSEDAAEYEALNSSWKEIGSFEDDGKLVLRTVNAPYYDIVAKKTKGLVEVVYLTDETCTDCYNPDQFKSYFQQNLGMAFSKETTVDVSSTEGEKLVKKYNISLIPTVLFSSSMKEYPAVEMMWNQMGKVVNGTYVFTQIDKLQGIVYKDLTTGETLGNKTKMPEIVIN